MKKLIVFCMGILMGCFSMVCCAGLRDYPTIAVLPFSHHAPAGSTQNQDAQLSFEDARIVSDYVLDNLVDCGEFQVMEREQMAAILSEHNLNVSGLVDISTAKEIGRLTGVQYLVYGSVVGCSLKESHAGYSNSAVSGEVENKRHIVIANVVGRFIDVETGRIVLTGRGKGQSTSTHNEINFSLKKVVKNPMYETNEYGERQEYIDEEISTIDHSIKFGSEQVSQVQVHNALGKAAYDLVGGEQGFLAKLSGLNKWKPKFKQKNKKK